MHRRRVKEWESMLEGPKWKLATEGECRTRRKERQPPNDFAPRPYERLPDRLPLPSPLFSRPLSQNSTTLIRCPTNRPPAPTVESRRVVTARQPPIASVPKSDSPSTTPKPFPPTSSLSLSVEWPPLLPSTCPRLNMLSRSEPRGPWPKDRSGRSNRPHPLSPRFYAVEIRRIAALVAMIREYLDLPDSNYC